jgi:ribose-phosphate pyrophosphokinase
MKAVAEETAKLSGGRIVLSEIEWRRFPDGWPNIKIPGASELKWCDAAFLGSFHDPSVIFEQLSVICALPKMLCKSFKLILPWFPTGTMEREQSSGDVATAQTLSKMLSGIPSCAGGPVQICIFDIHALQNKFYFDDSVLVRLSGTANLARQRIALLPNQSSVTVCFPDDGAAKRFGKQFPMYPLATCVKLRQGNKRIVKLKEGDVKAKHVIIVDDLVQSGGTLIQCALALKQAGASKVSAYCTHGIFPRDSWKQFVDSDLFEHFWLTNTNPVITDKLVGVKPFEIISIAPRVAELLLDI